MIGAEAGEEAFARTALLAVRAYPRQAHELRDVRSWLLRLARNVCIDLARGRHRDRLRHGGSGDGGVHAVGDRAGTPEEILLRKELAERIATVIDELSPLYHDVIRLHLEERSPRQIADALGIKETNARKRLQVAREAIRRGLRERRIRPPRRGPPAAESRVWTCIVALPAHGGPRECILFSDRPSRAASPRRIERTRAHMEAHGRGWKAIVEHARALRDAGHVDEALAAYERALLRRPDAADALAERTALLVGCGDSDRAAAACERALLILRGVARERIALWLAIARADADAIAVAAAVPAIPLSDRAAAAAALLRLGAPALAAALLEPLVVAHPDDATLLVLSHQALAACGAGAVARLRYEQAACADPRHPLLTRTADRT